MQKPNIIIVKCSLREEMGIISVAKDLAEQLHLNITNHRISARNFLFHVDVSIAFIVTPVHSDYIGNVEVFNKLITAENIFS